MFKMGYSLKNLLCIIRNFMLRINFAFRRFLSNDEFLSFRCNICGKKSTSHLSEIQGREKSSCYHCGSTLRFRSIIDALSLELFGKSLVLNDFPKSKKIEGIGMSDSNIYSIPLSKKILYKNTFYNKEPKLDISSISSDLESSVDFIITSDVFEHVAPPVEIAFKNLYKLLKKNGFCILSVPYKENGITEEHFPDLNDFKIIKEKGKKILVNKTRNGHEQRFKDLNFHGGYGATLEMRIFSESSLINNLADTGFKKIRIHENPNPAFGIIWSRNNSFPISMRK